MGNYLLFICFLMCLFHDGFGSEFTFDLATNVEQCFFEIIKENTLCNFEFQVSFIR